MVRRRPFWQSRRLNPEKREQANLKIRQRAAVNIAHRAEVQARRERAKEERRRIKREQAQALGVARKIAAPFYARKLPDGSPRLFSNRRNPVWVGPATASTLGRYNNAIGQLFRGLDRTAIDEFIGQSITDLDGNIYELVVDETEIRELIDDGHRVDYAKNYRAEAA